MTRESYDKFKKLFIHETYFIQDIHTDSDYRLPFAKIRDSSTIFIEKDYENLKINHGVFIDIFILGRISFKKMYRFKELINIELMWLLERKDIFSKGLKSLIGKTINYIYRFNRMEKFIKCENSLRNVIDKEVEGYVFTSYGLYDYKHIYSKNLFPTLLILNLKTVIL